MGKKWHVFANELTLRFNRNYWFGAEEAFVALCVGHCVKSGDKGIIDRSEEELKSSSSLFLPRCIQHAQNIRQNAAILRRIVCGENQKSQEVRKAAKAHVAVQKWREGRTHKLFVIARDHSFEETAIVLEERWFTRQQAGEFQGHTGGAPAPPYEKAQNMLVQIHLKFLHSGFTGQLCNFWMFLSWWRIHWGWLRRWKQWRNSRALGCTQKGCKEDEFVALTYGPFGQHKQIYKCAADACSQNIILAVYRELRGTSWMKGRRTGRGDADTKQQREFRLSYLLYYYIRVSRGSRAPSSGTWTDETWVKFYFSQQDAVAQKRQVTSVRTPESDEACYTTDCPL